MLLLPSRVQNTKKCPALRHWEQTRRIAFDADDDEEDVATPSKLSEMHQQSSTVKVSLHKVCEKSESISRPNVGSVQNKKPTQRKSTNGPQQAKGQKSRDSKPSARSQVAKQLRSSNREACREEDDAQEKTSATRNVVEEITYSADDWIICPGWGLDLPEEKLSLADSKERVKSWPKASNRRPRRKPRTSTKTRITFTDLPPEIRNTIYIYTVPECSVLITRNRPNKEREERKAFWSEEHIKQPKPVSRLVHRVATHQEIGDFSSVLNLMLTCKQIHGEVQANLYSRTFFHFFTLKDLRKFLDRAPYDGIKCIRKASIRQDGYGNPQLTRDQEYRKRYYDQWEKSCTKFGEMTPNLEHLKLIVYDNEWPCVLSGKDFDPTWKESILRSTPSLIAKVEVRLYHRMLHDNRRVLEDLERRIEDGMMTEEGRKERDRLMTEQALKQIAARRAIKLAEKQRRKVKLNAPPPPTDLVISMDDIVRQSNKAAATTVKVWSKGLEKFTKVNLATHDYWQLT